MVDRAHEVNLTCPQLGLSLLTINLLPESLLRPGQAGARFFSFVLGIDNMKKIMKQVKMTKLVILRLRSLPDFNN